MIADTAIVSGALGTLLSHSGVCRVDREGVKHYYQVVRMDAASLTQQDVKTIRYLLDSYRRAFSDAYWAEIIQALN